MNRRGFIGSILALGAAPAIVRASSLMPVFVREWVASPEGVILTPMTGVVSHIGDQWATINYYRNNAALASRHADGFYNLIPEVDPNNEALRYH